MCSKMIAFPGFKVESEFNNCFVHATFDHTHRMILVRSRWRFLNVRPVLSLMSCEASNLLKLQRCHSQLPICLSYSLFMPLSGALRLPTSAHSTDLFSSLVMLADSPALSGVRRCKTLIFDRTLLGVGRCYR